MTETIRVSDEFTEQIRNNSKDGETTAQTVDRLFGFNGKTMEEKMEEIARRILENEGRELVREEIEDLQNRY